jgi:ABC-type multidrug transport system ATPase subunit
VIEMALVSDRSSAGIAQQAPVLLQAVGLTKRYGDQHALGAVSFDVRHGEVLGLIGPNGAGKTTLLEVVAGVLPADEGEIRWRGSLVPIPHRRDFVFYLPDGLRPWDEQYVSRVLEFFSDVYGRTDDQVGSTIQVLDLAPVLHKRVWELSKGFGRRLMLALALLTPHPVLLMDEPFDGFDLRQTREVMGLLRQLTRDGRTLVLAIHQLADAERVCDRFVLLAAGAVRGTGTLDELRTKAGLPSGGLEEVFLALT